MTVKGQYAKKGESIQRKVEHETVTANFGFGVYGRPCFEVGDMAFHVQCLPWLTISMVIGRIALHALLLP